MAKVDVNLTKQINRIKTAELSYRTLHDTATIHDENSGRIIEIPFRSLTNKYRNFLSEIITATYIDGTDIAKYKFNPKMLSYDLYGTTEYWNDILILNNCVSITQFQPSGYVKVYNSRLLKEYLNEIMILEGLT